MKTSDVIKHFGTQTAAAAVIGIKQSSISLWGEHPPPARQLQIERLTDGALKAEPDCLERIIGMPLNTAQQAA